MSTPAPALANTIPKIPHKINGFRSFPFGWRYGEGAPPSQDTIDIAQRINSAAMRANLETDAFLGIDADIQVSVYYLSHYLQFTVDETGRVEYVREDAGREIDRRAGLSVEEALELLENFEIEVWRSSVSFTATTTIRKDVFETLLSRLPDAVRVFQSLRQIARFELAEPSADT